MTPDAIAHFRAILPESERLILEKMQDLERMYVTSPFDSAVRTAVDGLVARMAMLRPGELKGNPQESRAIAIIGDGGAGKTTAIKRVLETHPAFPSTGTEAGCPWLTSMSIRAPATLASVGRTLLGSVQHLYAERFKDQHAVWAEVRRYSRIIGLRFIWIDEVHDILLNANRFEVSKIRSTLRGLMNDPDHPIALILSGTPAIVAAMNDPEFQLVRRTSVVLLRQIDALEHARHVSSTVITGLASRVGLSVKDEDAIAPRLIHAVNGRFGRVIEMTRQAIQDCLRRGDNELRLSN